MSNKAELAVELSASYAHRVGDEVHVVVQLAEETVEAPARLQLRAGKREVTVEANATLAPGGTVYDASAPTARLGAGVWRIALIDAQGTVSPVQARLLNAKGQPIALLPGPVPTTELPAPRPAKPAPARRRRGYRTAAKVANRGLALLPDQQADRTRQLLRRAGRRVLG